MATKIYIDQGHNPQNPNAGSEGNGYREQDIVYTIGVQLSRILEARGYETRLSRNTPDEVIGTSNLSSLRARVEEANAWGADYFISLHTNASNNPAANGSEAFVYRSPSEAARLASAMLEQLNLSTGLRNRGVMVRPGLYVLRRTRMPSVLVELGFITNPRDADLMANSPELFAQGLADGITDFLRGNAMESFASISASANEPMPEGEYADYVSFVGENSRTGKLKIQASRGQMAYPAPGVRVIITKRFADGEYTFFSGITDENGIIDGIELPAPPRDNSLNFILPDKAAIYYLRTLSPEYEDMERQIEIFDGIKTVQPLALMQRRG